MSDRRIKKSAGKDRVSREAVDRTAVEDRAITDDERVEMFRQQFFQSALPDLPKIPGWHVCWLTTTNPRDSIQARMRLGYEPIKPDEVPGWEYASLKTGEYQGLIGVNEMVAFKIPFGLYQKYMHEAHYDAPMREEQKLSDTAKIMAQQLKEVGSEAMMGDGMVELGKQQPSRPTFTE